MSDGAEIGPPQAGQSGIAAADEFALISWFAKAHGQPFSASALRGKLPAGFRSNDRASIARALEAVGLKTRIVERTLRALDPAVLPSILFRRDGTPIILMRLSANRRRASAASTDE